MWLDSHLTLNPLSSILTGPVCLYRVLILHPQVWEFHLGTIFQAPYFSRTSLPGGAETRSGARSSSLWSFHPLSIPVPPHGEPVPWGTLEGVTLGSAWWEGCARFVLPQPSPDCTVSCGPALRGYCVASDAPAMSSLQKPLPCLWHLDNFVFKLARILSICT